MRAGAANLRHDKESVDAGVDRFGKHHVAGIAATLGLEWRAFLRVHVQGRIDDPSPPLAGRSETVDPTGLLSIALVYEGQSRLLDVESGDEPGPAGEQDWLVRWSEAAQAGWAPRCKRPNTHVLHDESRILNRADHPVIGPRRANHNQWGARLEHPEHLPPQVDAGQGVPGLGPQHAVGGIGHASVNASRRQLG